jgi:hypothetical protein
MTPLKLFRLTQALVLAAIVAALAVPAVALAGANSGYGPRDGWYTYAASVTKSDRKAASDSNRYGPRDGWYTYAVSVTKSDRKAASDSNRYGPPDGWYTQAVSLTDSAKALTADGRSPDTLDAAAAGQLQVADGRSPDTLDASDAAQTLVADGRSPDTLDATTGSQPIEVVQRGGFDWGDAGIGAVMGAALIGLLGSSILLAHRRHRVQTT